MTTTPIIEVLWQLPPIELTSFRVGMYVSSIIFFILFLYYNSTQYFILREKVFLWYCFYIFMSLLFYLVYNKLIFPQFLSSYHTAVSNWLICQKLLTPLNYLVYYQFVHLFLNIRDTSKLLNRLFRLLMIIDGLFFLIQAIMFFTGYEQEAIYYRETAQPISWVIVVILYFLMFRHIKLLYVFMYTGSFFLFVFTVAFFSLETEFDLLYPLVPIDLWATGVCLEMLVFSFGLAYKTDMIYQENERNQQEIIHLLREKSEIQQNQNEQIEQQLTLKSLEIEAQKKRELSIQFEKQMSDLRMRTLSAQMNPHFLFNSLNSLKLLALKGNLEQVEAQFDNLADLMRIVLNHTRQKEISLKDELDAIKLYVEIENKRFQQKFYYRVEVEQSTDLDKIQIPPMLIQPFVENAIWHGLMPLRNRSRRLIIQIENQNENTVKVIIEDNGVGRNYKNERIKSKLHSSKGIKMIQERIDLANTAKPERNIKFRYFDIIGVDTEVEGTRVVITFQY